MQFDVAKTIDLPIMFCQNHTLQAFVNNNENSHTQTMGNVTMLFELKPRKK